MAQNGATPDAIPPDAEAVFIGGNDPEDGSGDWKDSDAALNIIHQAKHLELPVHVGRVNSRRRILAFAEAGVDSVDGTYLAWGPDENLPKLLRFMRAAHHRHQPLPFDTSPT